MTRATSAIRRTLSVTALPLVLSLFGALACYAVAGPSLNLFLGHLVLLIVLAPVLVMAEASAVARLTALAASFIPFTAVGFFAFTRSEIHFGEWWRTTTVLLLFAFALSAISVVLRQFKCPITVSAAASVIVGLVWLTWPIWASRTWQGEDSAGRILLLSNFHPGMLIDGQLAKTSGGWASQTIAYHLTDLNQNVSYSPPRAIWPAIILYGVLAAIPFGLQFGTERRRRQQEHAVTPGHSFSAAPDSFESAR
jgi:hypothetical protein